MRNHKPGTILAAVSEAYKAAGGIEAASDDIGLSISTLSEATSEPRNTKRAGGLGINHLDNLCRINPASAAVLAQHFAQLAGGVYQPVTATVNVGCIYEAAGTVSKECGEAVCAILSAAQNATSGNNATAHREVMEAIASLASVRAQIEAQKIGSYHEH